MPISQGWKELTVHTLFDSEMLGSNEAISLFVCPLGSMSPISGKVKTHRDTNMWMASMLPSPQEFLITAIRCAFLNEQDNVIPIFDQIYWDTVLRLDVMSKIYWESPVALVADPMFLVSPEVWQNLSYDRRSRLLRRLGKHVCCDGIHADEIVVPGLTGEKTDESSPPISGLQILQQMPFGVKIYHNGKWPKMRILCALDGRMSRPIL